MFRNFCKICQGSKLSTSIFMSVILLGSLACLGFDIDRSGKQDTSNCIITRVSGRDTLKRDIDLASSGILRGVEKDVNIVGYITDAKFQDSVAHGVTVVDFWAPWCGACRMLGPTLDEVVGEFAGKVNIIKVNVDENRALAKRFDITSIPTILVFKHSKVVAKQIGAGEHSKLKLKRFIESVLD